MSTRLREVAVAASVVVGVLLGPAGAATAEHPGGPPSNKTAVVCSPYTYGDFDHPNRWYWGIKPRKCDLVKRGEESYGATTIELRSMRWRAWGPGRASGRGHTLVNSIGRTPIRVKLLRPRPRCGHMTFTKARVTYPRFNDTGRMRVTDWCL